MGSAYHGRARRQESSGQVTRHPASRVPTAGPATKHGTHWARSKKSHHPLVALLLHAFARRVNHQATPPTGVVTPHKPRLLTRLPCLPTTATLRSQEPRLYKPASHNLAIANTDQATIFLSTFPIAPTQELTPTPFRTNVPSLSSQIPRRLALVYMPPHSVACNLRRYP